MFGIDDLLTEGLKIIDKFVPDGDKKVEAQLAMQGLATQVKIAQIGVNQTQAASANWFVAGARPFVMWACGVSVVWNFIAMPIIVGFILIFDPAYPTSKIPGVDWGKLGPIFSGLFGV